jgi:hypothetical protein
VRNILASVVCVLAACASAQAAVPVVPRYVQLQARNLLGQMGASGLALVPTSVPRHFAFESYSVTSSPPGLEVTFVDQRFLKTQAEARRHEIGFETAYFKGALRSCSSGSRRSVRLGRTTVYSDGTTVWRCARTASGRVVRTSASGRLAESALAAFVVSAAAVP